MIDALDGEFAGIAESIARAEFAFWLGSGISRDVVPPVSELLRKAISHLQQNMNADDPDCAFRCALREVLLVGGLLQEEVDALNLEEPVSAWRGAGAVVDRMVGSYSKVLEVPVTGVAEADYMLWDAVDVGNAYGDEALEPDVEHVCLAVLLLEGSMPIAVSANWDGLIEAAMEQLTAASPGLLDVVVRQEDLRQRSATSELVKFHGCAVRARSDESHYRKLLVATKAQVAGWTENPDYALLVSHLEEIVATKPTLMMGLSAQDANIQAIFTRARMRLPWSWPANPPAVVLAEEAIGSDQRTVLHLVYGDSYPVHRAEIDAASLLGSYPKPFLHALVLWIIGNKLSSLADSHAPAGWKPASRQAIEHGLKTLRDDLASTTPVASEVRIVALGFARALAIFRGRIPSASATPAYEPLTAHTLSAKPDPNFDLAPLGWLALCLGFLKLRESAGDYVVDLQPPGPMSHGSCVLRRDGVRPQTVFAVKDAMALARLEADGSVPMDDSSVVVLHMAAMPQRRQRSRSRRYGRTLGSHAHELSFSDLAASSADVDELAERFREQVAV